MSLIKVLVVDDSETAREITEVVIGYDGIVIANAIGAIEMELTRKDIFLALAKEVPGAADAGGDDRRDGPDRPVTPARGDTDDVFDLAWGGEGRPLTVDAGRLEPRDEVHVIDVVAHAHDEQTTATLLPGGAPVVR